MYIQLHGPSTCLCDKEQRRYALVRPIENQVFTILLYTLSVCCFNSKQSTAHFVFRRMKTLKIVPLVLVLKH
ncbi:Uncharacterized protein APZ42_027928 [Daphnia magna]|uniref:Uncharacterized protein n=1 Tax=Daphnia magna TaxID=35525 RepID=A0A164QYI9_9CRUS|nr:Uncharacterized protein APZ42_027928 [Daphnia magna]